VGKGPDARAKTRFPLFTPQQPVQWFSPGVFCAEALQAAITSAFGAYLDKRGRQNVIDASALLQHTHRNEM
jgi:hypothetical protein